MIQPRFHSLSAISYRLAASLFVLLVLQGCSRESNEEPMAEVDPVLLKARIESALSAAADLPRDGISVEVVAGTVIVRGSLACEDCGGTGTPGGAGTVQQSLGAVVRAVPGVQSVEFVLQ